MSEPLSTRPGHLAFLCAQLDLGTPVGPLSRIYGGFQHRVWQLDTERGCYAIKQLSTEIAPDSRKHFNTTEAMAEAMAEGGIPAVYALRDNQGYLQELDGVGYLVHPWCEAKAIEIDQVSEQHALEVAGILARMHALDLDLPGLKQHKFDVHSRDNIPMLVELAQAFHVELADTLQRALPTFLEIVEAQTAAILVLDKHLVASHGDLDQKNVLWDKQGKPVLIDWESARKLNPGYEALLEALNWSGIGSHFDPALFGKFISTYQQAGGEIEQHSLGAAYHCILGDWVYWLMYNLGRCLQLKDREQRATGAKQLEFTLSALQRIMDHVPGLLAVSNPQVTDAEPLVNV